MPVLPNHVRHHMHTSPAGHEGADRVRSTESSDGPTPPHAADDAPEDRLEPHLSGGKAMPWFEGEWRAGLPGALGRPGMKMAKGFLDSLIRAISSRPEAREVDEAERLRQEVVGLYEEGLLGEAESAARRLVELQRTTVGEGHPEFASSLSNLALLVQKQGDCEAAEPLLRQALEIRRTVLGEHHPDFATSLNNLALLLCERQDLDAAEPLLRQALEIRRTVLGEHHPDYATGLSSLALFLCGRQDLDGAEPLLRQALEIRRLALGEQHPDFATSLNNLALLLCERQDPGAAVPLLRQALEVRREVLGEHHPDTESTADSLSSLLKRTDARPAAADAPPGRHSAPRFAERDLAEPPTRPERLRDAVEPQPREAGPPAGTSHPARTRNTAAMSHDLAELTRAFADASEGLLQEAARMQEPGLPPDLLALSNASACRRDFLELRAEALGLAAMIGVRTPAPERVATLPELATVLEAVAVAEGHWLKRLQIRDRALERLGQLLSFSCRDAEDQTPLDECLSQARGIQAAISSCVASELPPEAERLADGSHPLTALLALVLDPGELNGESWAEHYNATSLAFGKRLAVAAARGRIEVTQPLPPPEPATIEPEPGRAVASVPSHPDEAHPHPEN